MRSEGGDIGQKVPLFKDDCSLKVNEFTKYNWFIVNCLWCIYVFFFIFSFDPLVLLSSLIISPLVLFSHSCMFFCLTLPSPPFPPASCDRIQLRLLHPSHHHLRCCRHHGRLLLYLFPRFLVQRACLTSKSGRIAPLPPGTARTRHHHRRRQRQVGGVKFSSLKQPVTLTIHMQCLVT